MAEKTQQELNAEALRNNPQVAEWLAQIMREEWIAQLSGKIGTDVSEILANARKEINRQNAIITATRGPSKWSEQQMAEYFRCACGAMANRKVEPSKELDADGLITQALTGAVGSAGGYGIPEDFDVMVHERALKSQTLWPLVTIDPTTRDVVNGWEIVGYITPNEGANVKSRGASNTETLVATEPVFGPVSWTMRTMDARVPIKLDYLDDSPIALLNLILRIATDGFVRKREAYIASGGGAAATQPVGITNAEAGIAAVAVAGVDTVDRIMGFVGQLPLEYRRNATLVAASTLMFSVASTLAVNVRSAQFLIPFLPAMAESSDIPAGKLAYGDWKRYIVKRNVLMKMAQSTAAERWTLETAFQEKWDGKPIIKDAFRIGNVASYTGSTGS